MVAFRHGRTWKGDSHVREKQAERQTEEARQKAGQEPGSFPHHPDSRQPDPGDLHFAIFDAFDREDEHCYEFQFGKKPMDPNAIVFTMPEIHESDQDDMGREVCRADKAKIESLGLRVGQLFGYWFDFGDD